MRLVRIESTNELRRGRNGWDRLWERSRVTLPTARCELVAQWIEHFAPRSPMCALVVEQDGQMVAALPMATRRVRGLVTVADLTRNEWSPNGELLLDPQAEAEPVLDRIVDGLTDLRWPLAWLDIVPVERPPWAGLIQQLAERRLPTELHVRGRSAEVALCGSFDDYEQGRSSRFRYNLRRNWRRLEATGPIGARFVCGFTTSDVDRLLRQSLEIEQRSWKRGAGCCVLEAPGMFQFFQRQARTLAERGHLRLALLEHAGKPLAFELGYAAKGVYHSAKISFDQSFRQYGPGQLLRREFMRWIHEQPDMERIDFQAEAGGSLARWSNQSYPIARLIIAPGRLSSLALLAAYKGLAPLIRHVRHGLR